MVESVKRTDGVGAVKRKFCSVRPAARRFGSFRALRGQTSPPLVLLHAEYQRAKSKHGVDFWGVPNYIGRTINETAQHTAAGIDAGVFAVPRW